MAHPLVLGNVRELISYMDSYPQPWGFHSSPFAVMSKLSLPFQEGSCAKLPTLQQSTRRWFWFGAFAGEIAWRGRERDSKCSDQGSRQVERQVWSWNFHSLAVHRNSLAGNVDVMSCRQEPLKDMTRHVSLTCRQNVGNMWLCAWYGILLHLGFCPCTDTKVFGQIYHSCSHNKV